MAFLAAALHHVPGAALKGPLKVPWLPLPVQHGHGVPNQAVVKCLKIIGIQALGKARALSSGQSQRRRTKKAEAVNTRRIDVAVQGSVLSAVFLPKLCSFMKNPKLASDDAYSPAARRGESPAFNTLSRILVAMMGAAFLFFGLLLAPPEFGAVIDELLEWFALGLAAIVAFIVFMGLVERLTD
jgi:hypothetical protein